MGNSSSKDRAVFERIDHGNKGYLTLGNLVAAHNSGEDFRIATELPLGSAVLFQFDKDKDGRLSAVEFSRLLRRVRLAEAYVGKRKQNALRRRRWGWLPRFLRRLMRLDDGAEKLFHRQRKRRARRVWVAYNREIGGDANEAVHPFAADGSAEENRTHAMVEDAYVPMLSGMGQESEENGKVSDDEDREQRAFDAATSERGNSRASGVTDGNGDQLNAADSLFRFYVGVVLNHKPRARLRRLLKSKKGQKRYVEWIYRLAEPSMDDGSVPIDNVRTLLTSIASDGIRLEKLLGRKEHAAADLSRSPADRVIDAIRRMADPPSTPGSPNSSNARSQKRTHSRRGTTDADAAAAAATRGDDCDAAESVERALSVVSAAVMAKEGRASGTGSGDNVPHKLAASGAFGDIRPKGKGAQSVDPAKTLESIPLVESAAPGDNQLSKAQFVMLAVRILEEMVASFARDSVGHVVGDYDIGRAIGRGSGGTVWRATDTRTGELRAVKAIDKGNVASMSKVDTEIKAMATLRHKNVVSLDKVLQSEDCIFLVMELCLGGSLADLVLDAQRPLSERRARFYLRQIADGLEYCHSLGVCHRDLRAENVLLDATGTVVKIADFGHAGLCGQGSWDMFSTTLVGSLGYVSPEQLRGECYSGRKLDIWALGVILFYMLAGRLPFYDDNMRTFIRLVQEAAPEYPPEFPEGAKSLVASLLRPVFSDRASSSDVLKHPWVVAGEADVPLSRSGSALSGDSVGSGGSPFASLHRLSGLSGAVNDARDIPLVGTATAPEGHAAHIPTAEEVGQREPLAGHVRAPAASLWHGDAFATAMEGVAREGDFQRTGSVSSASGRTVRYVGARGVIQGTAAEASTGLARRQSLLLPELSAHPMLADGPMSDAAPDETDSVEASDDDGDFIGPDSEDSDDSDHAEGFVARGGRLKR